MFGFFKKWFKSTVDLSIVDKFRIRVIILKNGTKKYYPQFKNGDITSDYECILKLKNDSFILKDLNLDYLINNSKFINNEIEALSIIEEFKKELELIRSKELLEEEIIKL